MRTAMLLIVVCFLASGEVFADVRVDRKQQMLTAASASASRPGKAAPRALESSTIIKGNRRMKTSRYVAELVDLDEGKVYRIDHLRRRYSVSTFAELRRDSEESSAVEAIAVTDQGIDPVTESIAVARAFENAQRSRFERMRRQTGRRRAVNGFDAFEVVTTTRVDTGDATTSITTVEWLVPDISGYAELDAFEQRYKAALNPAQTTDESRAAASHVTSPLTGPSADRYKNEDDGSTGIPVLSVTTTGGQAETAPREDDQPAASAGKSRFGRLAGRIGRQALGVPDFSPEPANEPPVAQRATVQEEVVRVTTQVSTEEVSVPAGYKFETLKRR